MERNINELVAQMTLEEKAGLCSGRGFLAFEGRGTAGHPGRDGVGRPHGLRKQDQEADHLGINDSIKAVCFPAACATAASFDEALLERMGRALGEECPRGGCVCAFGAGGEHQAQPAVRAEL